MTENTQKTDRTLAEDDLVTQPLTQTMAEQQAEKGFWVNLLAQGLWRNNPAIVQLLGLCPLLAVSNSATNMAVSLFRKHIPHEIRIPIYVMIIATTVTVVQLLMNAYTYSLYQSLGIFIPLIVTNCIVIGRAEAFASKNSVLHSMFDGFAMGLGMTLSLFTLGALREILGNGTLFDGLDQLLGDWAKNLRMEFFHNDNNLLLAILPPGAFIGLGIILALKNVLDKHTK